MDAEEPSFLRVRLWVTRSPARSLGRQTARALEGLALAVALLMLAMLIAMHCTFVGQAACASEFTSADVNEAQLVLIKVVSPHPVPRPRHPETSRHWWHVGVEGDPLDHVSPSNCDRERPVSPQSSQKRFGTEEDVTLHQPTVKKLSEEAVSSSCLPDVVSGTEQLESSLQAVKSAGRVKSCDGGRHDDCRQISCHDSHHHSCYDCYHNDGRHSLEGVLETDEVPMLPFSRTEEELDSIVVPQLTRSLDSCGLTYSRKNDNTQVPLRSGSVPTQQLDEMNPEQQQQAERNQQICHENWPRDSSANPSSPNHSLPLPVPLTERPVRVAGSQRRCRSTVPSKGCMEHCYLCTCGCTSAAPSLLELFQAFPALGQQDDRWWNGFFRALRCAKVWWWSMASQWRKMRSHVWEIMVLLLRGSQDVTLLNILRANEGLIAGEGKTNIERSRRRHSHANVPLWFAQGDEKRGRSDDSTDADASLYIYSKEKGYLLLSESAMATALPWLTSINVTLSAHHACLGGRWQRLIIRNLVRYDTILMNSLIRANAKGYLYSIRTKEIYTLQSGQPRMADGASTLQGFKEVFIFKCGVLVTSLLVFFTTTTSVSFILHETQARMLKFTLQLQHHARHRLPTFRLIFVHVMGLLVFVPVMTGVFFLLLELFHDQLLAFMLLTLVWLCEVFTMISTRQSEPATRFFPRFFFLYVMAFNIYFFSFTNGFSYLAFFTMVAFLHHSVLFFWNRMDAR
eukprot:TRINITY_DN2215_c5_g1_i1.p1 TRINITY_DN2215_c5_g1~~TRINITY_DN2215_c5_g1_i1.p1  ORF type:complete len:739 (-),score=69.72 TRINITY_DN2215_c5_g1_i1:1442-3658(-)